MLSYDMQQVLAREMFAQYTVSRRTGAYVDGRWVDGTPEDVVITACIQPIPPEKLQDYPGGQRHSEGINIWTQHELRTVDEDNGIPGDVITYQGNKYVVYSVSDWHVATNHYHVVAFRENVER